jgi:fatty-acyl-CoA synthase
VPEWLNGAVSKTVVRLRRTEGSNPSPSAVTAALSPISFLLRSARVWSEQVAVRHEDVAATYAELLDEVQRQAGALRALGVQPGDRVAVVLPNVPEMLALHFAVPGLGAVLVPLNTRLAASEYAYILEHAGARVVVVHPAAQVAVAEAVAGLGAPPEVVALRDDGGLEERAAAAEPVAVVAPADETAMLSINYTSGTTGHPKGVVTTHRGAYLHALGVIAESALSPTSSYLWTLPMFHCNGWAYTWAVTAMGAKHVCVEAFDADAAWTLLEDEGVTHLCGAPTVFSMLAESPAARKLPQPARAFIGGAPPAPALIERLGRAGLAITHLYGLTETYGPVCVCARQPAWDALPEAEQAALEARQGVPTIVSEPLRVVDEDMVDVPADGETVGEVVMRGNNVMVGYYRDERATADAFRGGWFHSGDLGVMHPDGYLELRDRLKDVVISGGENIATIEIEQALLGHDQVVDAAVIGVPHERWGETPRAYVVLRAGGAVDADALQEFLRGSLAGFKVPREIVFLDDLPKTATGKTQKYVLRDEARHKGDKADSL